MTLSLMVCVGYISPAEKLPRHTHINVSVDDCAPLSKVREAASEAATQWAHTMGYRVFEWEIKNVYLGRADFFRGAVQSV